MSIQGAVNQAMGTLGVALKGKELIKGTKGIKEEVGGLKGMLSEKFGMSPEEATRMAPIYAKLADASAEEYRAKASVTMQTEQGMKAREAVKAQRQKLITGSAEVNELMQARSRMRK